MTGSGSTLALLYSVMIIGIFYFIWYRPQQAQRKKMQTMLMALASGDRVMTAGGMIGIVRLIEEDMVDLEIAPGVIARFTKRAIIDRLAPSDSATDV